MKAFIDRYVLSVPVLLPMAALAHLFWTGYTFGRFIADGTLMSFIGGGTSIILLLYTLLWLGVCAQKRWAGIGYIALTAINLCLQFLTPEGSHWRFVADALFPFDVLMCFFILFYYKRLH
jgi:hypothetical protein